jgi:hypothetical protein
MVQLPDHQEEGKDDTDGDIVNDSESENMHYYWEIINSNTTTEYDSNSI